MHGGEVDEGYCIVDSDALEESMTSGTPSRRQLMLQEFFGEVKQLTELDVGYSFQFSADSESVGKLVELITEERKDNPSIEFEIIFEENKGPLVLEIKGETAKDYVKSLALASFF